MTRAVSVSILARQTLAVRYQAMCYAWEINLDAVENTQSWFQLHYSWDVATGDVVLVKFPDGAFHQIGAGGGVNPLYIGFVASSEKTTGTKPETKVNAYGLMGLLDLEFPATYQSGGNVQEHFKRLIERYFTSQTIFQPPPLSLTTRGDGLAHLYQPNDPPTATSLLEYGLNIFKKYGVLWQVDELVRDRNGHLTLATSIGKPSGSLHFKNNVADFRDWDIYITPANKDVVNHLSIVSKSTTNSEQPRELTRYFLGEDGSISTIPDKARLPVKSKVSIYDEGAADKPSYESVARDALAGSLYAHEIRFSVSYESKLCRMSDLVLGMESLIVYDEKQYASVLSKIKLTSSSDWIEVTFGHIRSTMKNLLK